MSDESNTIEQFDLRVRQVMRTNPLTIEADSGVEETARGMERCQCGCCLVESGGKIVGIVTERDIVRRVAAKGSSLKETKVSSIMSSPIVVVSPDASVEDALKIMAEHKIKRLPVVGDKGLLGLVSMADVAKLVAEKSGRVNSLINALAAKTEPPEGVYA